MKKLLTMVMTLTLLVSVFALAPLTTAAAEATEKLTIAYQYGLSYLPLVVMKDQKLIEKYYPNVQVEWQILNSGAAINEGMITGSIDVGAMGIAPAITGVIKGIPYKIFSNLSSQPQVLVTNKEEIKSMADITPDHKIAVVNVGSIQHIFIAMAAKNELGDAHAMDNNIVAMSHPDGMAALLSGSVDCQMATSPYVFMEREAGMHEFDSVAKVWPDGNSFIVGMASQKLKDERPELYAALVKAMDEANDYLTNQKEDAAKTLCAGLEVDADTLLTWLSDPGCGYTSATKGVMQMATFMVEEGFVDNVPFTFADLAYDNVVGE